MTDRFWTVVDGEIVGSESAGPPATVGSSDAAAILGLSPWRSAWDVWPGMVGLVPRYSRTDDGSQRRGRRLEPVILDWYAEDYGVQVMPGPGLFREGDEPLTRDGWAHDHPDAFEVDGWRELGRIGLQIVRQPGRRARAVEVKSLRWFDSASWGDPGSDAVPVHYLAQCAHHQFVTGLPVVLVAYATGSDEMRVYNLDLDGGLVTHQAQILKAWHEQHVVAGHPPPVDGSEACNRGLGRVIEYMGKGKRYRDATPREIELVREIADLNTQIKALARRQGEAESALRLSIGADYGLKAPNGKSLAICYPVTSLDEDALKAAHPDIDLNAYRKHGSVDRKRLRLDHAAAEASASKVTGRTFKTYASNLPTPVADDGGESW